jgi:alpha-beta hydrolase superfamily lysophospholipase
MATTAAAPPADREETLTTHDGLSLHVGHFLPRGTPRLALVAIHGFTTYSGPYGAFFLRLAEAGIAVTCFDCRGHGRSTGRRGFVARFGDFHSDLALVAEAARKNHPSLPWALLGHSHGGTIAADAVLSKHVTPDRLVLAAPWLGLVMKVPAWKEAMSGVMSRLWPTLALDNGIKVEDASRNPLVIDNFFKDPNIHHVAAARWYTEVLATQARIRENAAQLGVPTLLLSAGEDRVVANPPIDALAAAAPGFVTAKRYPGLFHELFLEPEWEEVTADVTRWLLAPLSSGTRSREASSADPAILPSAP